MYSYHGWLSSSYEKSIEEFKRNAPEVGSPIFVGYVNGMLQASFNGNANRDRGELKKILDYFLNKDCMFHGIVYINDSHSENIAEYKVLKIFRNSVTESKDKYFSKNELYEIFL